MHHLSWKKGAIRIFLALTLLWVIFVGVGRGKDIFEGVSNLSEFEPALVIYEIYLFSESLYDTIVRVQNEVRKERIKSGGEFFVPRFAPKNSRPEVYIDREGRNWTTEKPVGRRYEVQVGRWYSIDDIRESLTEEAFQSFWPHYEHYFKHGYVEGETTVNERSVRQLLTVLGEMIVPPLSLLFMYYIAAWCVKGFLPSSKRNDMTERNLDM